VPRAKKFNGGNRKKKKAKIKPRSNGKNGDRFVQKEVEELPADFPKLQPVAVAVQARPTRQRKALTGARPTVETFSCLLMIDTKLNGHRPKFRVHGPERAVACSTMAEATDAAMRPLKVAGCDVRGVALDADLGHHFSLFPIGQPPNFAGDNALGRWD
jgi:hypothetical protein